LVQVMTDFGGELRRLMADRGLSLRETARRVPCDSGYLSKVAAGRKRPSPELGARLDAILKADGTLRELVPQAPRREASGVRPVRSGAVEALQVAMTGAPDSPDIGGDGLAELVLLAISAADQGDHAAAIIWCTDAERRGREAGYRELLGWAALTRSLIAWYQGDPLRSAAVARRGQVDGQAGSVAHAKLAAHEMRCRAMLGDTAGMAAARHTAAAAMTQIGPSAPASGVFSVPHDDDPPYNATSLLLAGQHAEAAAMTRRLIQSAYQPLARAPWDQPTNYARTLLILALAAAGLGELDEAAAAGTAALACGRVVWPTIVLAGKLDQSLTRRFPGDKHTADFHARYLDAGGRLALTAAPAEPGKDADDQ
jgi:transcriptional regulator with XRE-family HTH domain